MTTVAPSTIEQLVMEVLDETDQCQCRATDCQHERDAEGQCLSNAKYRLVDATTDHRPILLCEACLRFLCDAMNIDFNYLLATGHRRPARAEK